MSDELSYVGKRLARPDIAPRVTGQAEYTEDIVVAGMLEGRPLRSPHAHARIRSIDTSKARALPGVVAVITHHDVPARRFTRSTLSEAMPAHTYSRERQDQYVVSEKARFIGDWVAAVAAEDIYAAERALELIEVDYEPLPAVFDPFCALEERAPRIHDDAPGNVAFEADFAYNCGDVESALAAADVVVEFSGVNSRQKHLHLETDAAIAWWDVDGRLTVISPAQGPHLARRHLSKRIFTDVEEGDIRWITPSIGGSFGARLALGVEPLAVMLAKVAGRPVRVTTTREEDFSGYSSRTDQHQTIRVGGARDGTITALEQQIVSDSGAYLSQSASTSMVNLKHTLGVFRCPNLRGHAKVVYTNTPTTSGFRGYGNPEGAFVLQQAVDMFAEQLDMDPVEVRLKNIRRVGDPSLFPPRVLEHTQLERCIRVAAERFGWKQKWSGWGRAEGGRRGRGVGMSALTNTTSAGGSLLEHSNAAIKVAADGSADLIVSPSEMGQGILGGLRQVAAEASGLELERIRVLTGDTDVTLFDIGSHASRSMSVIGMAVVDAAAKVKDQIRALSVARFDDATVTTERIEVREGRVFLEDDPGRGFDVREVAHDAIYNFGSAGAQIFATGSHISSGPSPNHQAAFAEVEVDTATGQVQVLKYVVAHDIGRAINPQLVEAQLEGGAVQGLGFALTEELTVDPDSGRVLSDSLFAYRLPTSMDVPDMENILVEDPAPVGPYGAKGVGEAPMASPAAAVANAVYDAVGIRIHCLPIAPDRVLWQLLHEGAEEAAGSSRVTGQFVRPSEQTARRQDDDGQRARREASA